MATNTTKLALTKPDGTDLVDIAVLNANADKIDAASGATICTSTTRPASPWNGQLILETDTNNFYVYITAGATWLPVGSAVVSVTKPTSAGKGSFWMDPDTMKVYIYYTDANSSQWVEVGGGSSEVPTTANATTRDAMYPSPVQGNKVFRNDLGFEQTYYGAWNATTNPGGRDSAGWYDNQRNIGLVPMVPTSVDKSGGTATTSGLGVVTFSGVNSVSLNGIFTTEYSRYRINLNNFASSVNSLLNFRGRTSGTDFTGTNYYWSYGWTRTATTAPATNGASSENKVTFGGINSPGYSSGGGWLEIDRPRVAANKILIGQFWGSDGTGMIQINNGAFILNSAQFDGFTIYPATGTLSGDIQVFGFND